MTLLMSEKGSAALELCQCWGGGEKEAFSHYRTKS